MPATPHYSITLRLPASLYESAQACAKGYNMSVPKFIVYCLEDGIKYVKEQEHNKEET